MEKRVFRYGWPIRMGKILTTYILFPLSAGSSILFLVGGLVIRDFDSLWLSVMLLAGPFVVIVYRLGLSDITVGDEGLWVEGFFKDYFVPWEAVGSIKYITFRIPPIWFIQVKGKHLTFFHYLFGIYVFSWGKFIPVGAINGRSELLSTIKKNSGRRSRTASQSGRA